jgi:IS605 OrfB family transposase
LDNIFMQIRKGYKYRLKTNRSTGAQFVRFVRACRFVWNKVLSINEHRRFKHVAAKAGLNKAMLDQGWGMFRQMLEYKQAWRGGELLAVPPRYTSQECPQCGHVSMLNRPQQALFSCVACGYTYHADVVAAMNVLARGQRERLNACAHPQGVPGITVL